MNILQVISSFPPAYAYGGALRVAHGIAKELVKRGHEVTVYTTDVYDARCRFRWSENPMYMDGIKVYHFRNISNKLAHENLAVAPMMAGALNRSITNFDIIHLHECRSFQAILTHHYAKKHAIPYILQVHGSLPRIMVKQRWKKLYDNLWGYRFLKDASRIIAITRTEAEQYKSLGISEHKIEIVTHGIDLSEFDNLPERGEFRRKYSLGSDQKIILYLGRIHKIKGLDLLTKAFADLSRNLNNVKLVVVGSDEGYLPSLKKLVADLKISDKVLFTGPLYEEDKLEAYVDADIYVLPSFYEIFGITVLEALACDTPVIVTDRCGIAEVIEGQAGSTVPFEKEQLQHAILQMLDDDKMRERFSKKGKLLVREKFNWEKIAEQVERLYKEVL